MSANFSSAPACKPIIPIYPVRYGYINIFDDLVPAANPPELSVMMNNRDVKQTKGYAIRLLREGWVYIREEDSNELLHIFKYTQKQNGDAVTECFEKYLYKNKKNAQGGLVLDTSVRKDLPFAFVSADTSQISIVYTEHELSPNLIDRMHQKKDVREQSMQLIDLSAEQTNHSVKATEENLKGLVEDYRDLSERMLTEMRQEGDSFKQVDLDIFTTQTSYRQTTDKIAEHLDKEFCSKERSRVIALYDPVGRQSDIALSHTLLCALEKTVKDSEIYPRTISDFILQLDLAAKRQNTSASNQIRSAISENINVSELNKFNAESDKFYSSMGKRKNDILDLFSSYSYRDMSDGSIGSLDVYLKMFFDTKNIEQPLQELNKINLVISKIFEGVEGTKDSQDLLVSMINAAYENEGNNVYLTYQETLSLMLLQCQDLVDWGEVSSSLVDNTPRVLLFFWSWVSAIEKYGKGAVVKSAMNLKPIAYAGLLDFIPTFFEKGFGIVDKGGNVRITLEQLGIVLAKNIDSMGRSTIPIKKAEIGYKYGKALINWANKESVTTLPKLKDAAKGLPWPELTVPNYGSRYIDFDADNNLTLLGKSFDGAISMLSFLANMDMLFQLSQISEYEKANPTQGNHWLKSSQNTAIGIAAVSAAAVDSLGVQRGSLLLTSKVLNSSRFYYGVKSGLPRFVGALTLGGGRFLVNKIESRLDVLKEQLKSKLFTKFIAASNLALLYSSTVNAIEAYQSGNRGLMYANINSMIAYSMFAVGPIMTIRGLSSATINSGYFAFVGFALLIYSEMMKIKFTKTEFEEMLFSCFWGRSEVYKFWRFEREGDFDLSQRLDFSSKNYNIEFD
ncbi:hypothetical protein EGH82_22010 [Vibrio ponticus]|uniref:Toxin VasX N-terminal region domain-containing protein n=1 Tax=Vibrio ponticus TaxID=265668 RepID=A0A3N3DT32_9VIBR|nr:toxin VasX [Vibrio ponticus]ROV57667.1 hypothetical protein EGH82_22010 [Vibrio ponticus]